MTPLFPPLIQIIIVTRLVTSITTITISKMPNIELWANGLDGNSTFTLINSKNTLVNSTFALVHV